MSESMARIVAVYLYLLARVGATILLPMYALLEGSHETKMLTNALRTHRFIQSCHHGISRIYLERAPYYQEGT